MGDCWTPTDVPPDIPRPLPMDASGINLRSERWCVDHRPRLIPIGTGPNVRPAFPLGAASAPLERGRQALADGAAALGCPARRHARRSVVISAALGDLVAIVEDGERTVVSAVAALTDCNSFVPERVALERTILGDPFEPIGLVWYAAGDAGEFDPMCSRVPTSPIPFQPPPLSRARRHAVMRLAMRSAVAHRGYGVSH